MTWTALLSLAAMLSSATGCMSAETSEASQLTRLEHGIDVSTTAPDRFTSRGELPGDGTPDGSVPPRAERIVAAPVMPPNDPGPTTEETADESAPRPTIRIWGSPNGHSAPGFVPVSKIVEGAAPLDPPSPAK